MNNTPQEHAAHEFAARWAERGYEKGESQLFWTELLAEVLGVERPSEWITFEEQVRLDHTSFIDAHIRRTHVLIEQKSLGKDLRAPIRQSDGSLLSPFQQAKRYAAELPRSQHPRWIVTCNFSDFLIYDMERPNGEPEHIALADLGKEHYRLRFLTDTGEAHIQREMELSLAAGQLVGMLYDKLLEQYIHPSSPATLRSLNVLCVRLVFCLYAEDAGVFPQHDMFHDFLAGRPAADVRRALLDLFLVLNTPAEQRDPYMDERLAAFPYVNGGLFAEQDVEVPRFTDEITDVLLSRASLGFNWSDISPTIFGAVFESTLNPETRRRGGMHYTSLANIHKVIDPLFLDGLRSELAEAKSERQLKALQSKLASLSFLDPACGSGNFLTETYISLRRIENEIIRRRNRDQSQLGFDHELSPIEVSISQFYGIELNDFAVTVARTALWIAEHQMLKETQRIVYHSLDFLPLKSYNHIREGDALKVAWDEAEQGGTTHHITYDYIIGNPPFVGYSLQSKEQKEALLSIYVDDNGKPYKTAGKIDFVAAWFFKAAQLMSTAATRCAFVATNSICQGEQVAAVWKPLYSRFGVEIDFAYRTFRWDSESEQKAHVHCIIVGFHGRGNARAMQKGAKLLFDGERYTTCDNINPYLIDGPATFVESRSKALCDVPMMVYGNKPVDGGFLFIKGDELDAFLRSEPSAEKFVRRIYGSEEYINNRVRYCLWLKDASPSELRAMPHVMARVHAVRDFRLASTKEATRRTAETPTLFQEERQPSTDYIIVPRVSSENRRYVPMGFLSPDIIINDSVQIIPDATLYHFGVLTSNVHMAWMRAVCGRLEMRYRYSKDVVYNNFPWPTPTSEQKAAIEQTAKAILDARALYPESSLADLYDEAVMPVELRRAHQANDRAVMQAYAFPVRAFSEQACVARLMALYKHLSE